MTLFLFIEQLKRPGLVTLGKLVGRGQIYWDHDFKAELMQFYEKKTFGKPFESELGFLNSENQASLSTQQFFYQNTFYIVL